MEFLKDFEWEEASGEEEANPTNGNYQLVQKLNQKEKQRQQAQQQSLQLDVDKSNWGPEELAAYALLRSKRKKCVIPGCTSRSIPLARSYHQLPVRNVEVWQKWVEAIRWAKNDPDWLPLTDQPLVCSRHFHPETDFVSYEGSSRSRLIHTAIPTLYLDPPEGTVMDHRFQLEREPPKYTAGLRPSRSQMRNRAAGMGSPPSPLTMPLIQPFHATSGMAHGQINRKMKVGAGAQEFMEVTPEFNFEEMEDTSEYDGETYEEMQEDDSADGYEEQIGVNSPSNVSNGRLKAPQANYYDESEVADEDPDQSQEQEEAEFYPPPPPLKRSVPAMTPLATHRRPALAQRPPQLQQGQSQSQAKVPKLQAQLLRKSPNTNNNANSSNSIIKTEGGMSLLRQGLTAKQPMRALGRQSLPNGALRTGAAQAMSSLKIDKVEGGVTSHFPPRKILMKVPPVGRPTGSPTQKHKIGMSKCRHIVDTIEEEMEAHLAEIKARVAQEMDIPLQVVNGVWQIKDQIKSKSANQNQNSF